MKTRYLPLLLALVTVFSFALTGCQKAETEKADLWETALYTEDKTFGEGAKTVSVKVTAGEKSVVFTVNTDEQYLSGALMEHKLISGSKSTYGLYVESVNGMYADYDKDKAYWAFYGDGEYMNVSVDGCEIAGGENFELKYEVTE